MENKAENKKQKKSCLKLSRMICYRWLSKACRKQPKLRKMINIIFFHKKKELIISRGTPDLDYFLDVDDDMLNYLETQVTECIGETKQSNSVNKENAQKLLSILIVGIGSSFLLLTQEKYPFFLTVGIGVFTLYWAYCAMFLVMTVMSGRFRKLAFAPPNLLYTMHYKNISSEDFKHFKIKGFKYGDDKLGVLRRIRLIELCEISHEMIRQNVTMGKHLNRARIGAILAPVCAIAVSVITYLASHH